MGRTLCMKFLASTNLRTTRGRECLLLSMHRALSVFKVEEPINNQDPIGNLLYIKIAIRLGLNFDLVWTEFQ